MCVQFARKPVVSCFAFPFGNLAFGFFKDDVGAFLNLASEQVTLTCHVHKVVIAEFAPWLFSLTRDLFSMTLDSVQMQVYFFAFG